MMVYELKFADFGEGIHEGEVLAIYVGVGDTVKVEQELLEVHTDKITTDITAPVSGVVTEILCEVDQTIEVGDVLFKIDTDDSQEKTQEEEKDEDDDPSLFKVSKRDGKTRRRRSRWRETKTSTSTATRPQQVINEKVLAAPAVRRRAREEDVDLKFVKGSGPAGRIRQEDLERYLKGERPEPKREVARRISRPKYDLKPGSETRIPLKGTRKTIARAMRHSKDTAAHYTYFEEVEMTALDNLRQQLKPLMEEKGIKVTYVALVMKCLVPALKAYPLLNAELDDENNEIIIRDYYNIGISVDTPEGLVVPVVKHVEQKTIWEVADDVIDLATRARNGDLTLDDISGGTFTITSIGNIGGVMATPIIKSPESAILGLMKAKLRPVVIEENGAPEIAIRKMMYLSLSLDHRIVDGAVGARFINELIKYMENPALVWID